MNIVNRLTIKHLKMNRRRTLVTIVGVIISAAMITAVVTLPVSFLDMMARNTIARDGLWHAAYYHVNGSQLRALEQDENTASLSAFQGAGFAELESPASNYKPFLYIERLNTAAFENYHVKLLSGRLPENESELIVSSEFLEQEGLSVGLSDQLELAVGQRAYDDPESEESASVLGIDAEVVRDEESGLKAEHIEQAERKTYTVVGIMERPSFEYTYQPAYHCLSYLNIDSADAADSDLDVGAAGSDLDGGAYNAYVVWEKPNAGLFHSSEELAKANGIPEDNVSFHYELLRYQRVLTSGGTRDTLMGLAAVIMAIIVVGSVSLIYNAFAISVSERFRHLGMLASVGATARQKRNSVFFEGFVIGAISIPLGILFGLSGIEITFWCISPLVKDLLEVEEQLHAVVSWGVILAAALLSAFTILISVYLPARKAGKIAPIDAIRQTTDVKLTGKMVKTSRITQKLFGVEGTVALKNLKRNRRRYKTTIFSLVISLVLFLTVSYFGESLRGANEMSLAGIDFDTYVRFSRGMSDKDIDLLAGKLKALPEADSAVDLECCGFVMPIDSSSGDAGEAILVLMGDEELRRYAKQAGLSGQEIDALFDGEGNWAIAVNETTYRDTDTGKFVTRELFPPEKDGSWTLYSTLGDEENSGAQDGSDVQSEPQFVPTAELRLAAYTGEVPAGVGEAFYDPRSPKFIVSRTTGQRVIAEAEKNFAEAAAASAATSSGTSAAAEDAIDGTAMWRNNRSLYFVSEDPEALFEALEAVDEPDMYIYSFVEIKKKEDSMILFINVFLYGFITLITLICIANIFNTISTSIMLRKREFAMLRSVGMTPSGFNRMIRYESIFYEFKALLYGLPISLVCMLLLYRAYATSFEFPFILPVRSVLIAILAVFIIVFVTMMYSSAKIKKENIVESLRQEII